MNDLREHIGSHIGVIEALASIEDDVAQGVQILRDVFAGGGKVLVCGNGGSAADAQHFAAEITGRFKRERGPRPAVALTTDSSVVTAVANDYGYDRVFSRQVEGLGANGDVMIGISTSGNASNVARAMEAARCLGMTTVGLLGRGGGDILPLADLPIVVPSDDSARIQEAHVFLLHLFADEIERGWHADS